MSFQPPSLYANIGNGRKSPGSNNNSRISNGSSFEMIPPSSGSRTSADSSFLNFPLGAPLSFSDITAEQALERVQELMKENQNLRDFLKENNSVINNKYQELAKWNERIKKYHKHNQEKCEEAKTVILNLRSENDDLKKQLQETKTQAFHTLNEKIHQLEKEKKDLEDEKSKDSGHQKHGEDHDNLDVFVQVDDEQTKQQHSERITMLEVQVREFRDSNEQLIKDMEKLREVKDNIQTENSDLTNQNIELSQKLQNVLSDCKAAKAENRHLKQQIDIKKSQSDTSLAQMGYSLVQGSEREKENLQRSSENPKDCKEINQLQEMIQKLQIEIHEKNRTLDEYRMRQEQEVLQLTQKHQMELMKKLQSAKEEQSSDIRSLQAQVLALINEVTESQSKCEAATATIDQKNARISDVEMIAKRKQEETNKVLQDLNNLKSALSNYEAALNIERREHQNTKKQTAELRSSFNQMVSDYKDLLSNYENYKKKMQQSTLGEAEKQKLLTQIGTLTAQVLAAEEAVKYRDEEVKDLKEENHRLTEEVNSTIPVLKAQGEIWQADFHAEREAREKMHTEKETLIQDMNQLQIQNQHLLDEVDALSRGQFAEFKKRHVQQQPSYSNQIRSRLDVVGHNKQIVYPYPKAQSHEHAANKRSVYPPQTEARQPEENSNQAGNQQTEDYILNCPKCNQVCPDLDSLQIHVLDCIEN